MKTWGKVWHHELPHSMDYHCPGCNDSTMSVSSGSFVDTCKKHIVGFDAGSLAAVFECPACWTLFWFHLNPVIIDYCFKEFVPNNK